jgi:uncharacterized protein (TIGR03435 family)
LEIDTARVAGGSNSIDSDSWDINAGIPAEFAQQTREKVPQMLQSLLTDRFKLVIHREPRLPASLAQSRYRETGCRQDRTNRRI